MSTVMLCFVPPKFKWISSYDVINLLG